MVFSGRFNSPTVTIWGNLSMYNLESCYVNGSIMKCFYVDAASPVSYQRWQCVSDRVQWTVVNHSKNSVSKEKI